MTDTVDNVPDPIEGKYIFQADSSMQIRFNADGWVEEIGRSEKSSVGTRLQGKQSTKLDDIYARRYYDLHSRSVILDIFPNRASDQSGAGGVLSFKDLEQGSVIYTRVQTVIAIANKHFGMNIKPLT